MFGVTGSMLIAILGSTFLGHMPCNCVAYCGFSVGSIGFVGLKLYILLENFPQCENPTVCAAVQ